MKFTPDIADLNDESALAIALIEREFAKFAVYNASASFVILLNSFLADSVKILLATILAPSFKYEIFSFLL